MSRGKDFREPRRRGFDDDNFGARDSGPGFQMPRQFGGPPRPAATGPIVDAVVKSSGRKSVLAGAKVKARVGQGQKGPQVTEVLDVDESSAAAQPARRPGPLGARPQRAAP